MLTAKKAITKNVSILFTTWWRGWCSPVGLNHINLQGFGSDWNDFILIGLFLQMFMNLWKKNYKSNSKLKGLLDVYLHFMLFFKIGFLFLN